MTFPRASDEGGPQWIQVTTPHFALATDMDREPAGELSRTLESWWAAMGVAFPEGMAPAAVSGDPEPILVVALRDSSERDAVHYQYGGLFAALPLLPPAISVGDFDDEHGRETLKHELAHAFLHQRLPRVPNWLTEGMAVYLQTAEIDSRRGVVQWGFWNASEMRNVLEYGGGMSVASIMDRRKWAAGKAIGEMELYAGLLVHMLINRRPAELECYLKRLATEIDTDAALTCFTGRDKWDFELRDYAYSWSFARKTVAFDSRDTYGRITPLGDARVHATLALLDFAALFTVLPQFREERVARALANVARALTIEPDEYLGLLLTLTRTEVDERRHGQITQALVAKHPGDWRAWVARAQTPGLPFSETTQAMDRAWSLAPQQTEVIRLAAIRALQEGRWNDARALGIKAWLGGADEASDRLVLFLASALGGSCTEASRWSRSPSDTKAFNDRLADVQKEAGLPMTSCPSPATGGR